MYSKLCRHRLSVDSFRPSGPLFEMIRSRQNQPSSCIARANRKGRPSQLPFGARYVVSCVFRLICEPSL